MKLGAVAFDYGKVLSGPQDAASVAHMQALTGLVGEQFEAYYRTERLAYDRGELTAIEYWSNLLRAIEVAPAPQLVAELIDVDAKSWMGTDPRILEWTERIAANGTTIAILSNMPETVLAALMAQHASWIERFPVRIFSCDVCCVKPDTGIYELLLSRVGLPANEVLFIDDKTENIEGATKVGMQGLLYSTADEVDAELLSQLGLPPIPR